MADFKPKAGAPVAVASAPAAVLVPPAPVSHASPEALKAALATLLEHAPEYLTTLQGMTPERHELYTKARNAARKLLLG